MYWQSYPPFKNWIIMKTVLLGTVSIVIACVLVVYAIVTIAPLSTFRAEALLEETSVMTVLIKLYISGMFACMIAIAIYCSARAIFSTSR